MSDLVHLVTQAICRAKSHKTKPKQNSSDPKLSLTQVIGSTKTEKSHRIENSSEIGRPITRILPYQKRKLNELENT